MPVRRREVGHAGVAADHQPGVRHQGGQSPRSSRPASTRSAGRPAPRRPRGAAHARAGTPVTTTECPAAAQLRRHRGEALDRPAPRRARRRRDAPRWPRAPGAARPAPARSQVARRRRDPRTRPAAGTTGPPRARPARHGGPSTPASPWRRPPAGAGRAACSSRWLCGPRPCRFTASAGGRPDHGERRQLAGRERPCRTAPVSASQRGQRRRARPGTPPPSGRHGATARSAGTAGEEVAEPERPLDEDRGSARGRRPSRPGGLLRRRHHQLADLAAGRLGQRHSTVAATSSGRLSLASGPGRYCSVRSSKNAVCMPPGTSRVTPTRPAQLGRERPGEAHHAELGGAVGGRVADRLEPERRGDGHDRAAGALAGAGRAARTTATVPSRLTATTRSHVSAGTSASGPQRSMPAAVTTASRPPPARRARPTASSAARPVGQVDDLVLDAGGRCAHGRARAGGRRPRRRRRRRRRRARRSRR